MAIMDWVNDQKKRALDTVAKFKNKDFLDGIVAGCVLVAFSDGSIDSSEKAKMTGYINRSELLKVFDMAQVISRFNYFADMMEFDFTVGKSECLKAISKIKRNIEEAKTLVSVCCAIGAADGNFDKDEKEIVRLICKELNVNPSDFQL